MSPPPHAPAAGKVNDMEPKFFAEFNALVADTPLDQIKTYLRWHLLHAYAGTSMPESLRNRELEFLRAHSERRREAAGTLEALHQPRRSRNGRGAGPGLRRQVLPAGSKSSGRWR